MSYQQERDQFIATMSKEGMPLDVVRATLRDAATLDRLAVAACNGDYPCDNGTRKAVECSKCGGYMVREAMNAQGVCRECRTEERAAKRMPSGFTLSTQGDPRGYVVKILTPSGREVGVPTRNS